MARKPETTWTERELELQARINAIEYLLRQVHWQFVFDKAARELIAETKDPADVAVSELKVFRKRALEQLKGTSIKGVDPALSDHVSALVREHVERVLEELIAGIEGKHGPKGS